MFENLEGEVTKIEKWDETHNLVTIEGGFCKMEYVIKKGDYNVGDHFKAQIEGSWELVR